MIVKQEVTWISFAGNNVRTDAFAIFFHTDFVYIAGRKESEDLDRQVIAAFHEPPTFGSQSRKARQKENN